MSLLQDAPRNHSTSSLAHVAIFHAYERCQWYELALMRHGFTVERLQKLARKVAHDACAARGATLQERMDDLVSRLVMAGLQASLRYDPMREQASYGSNGGEPFASYLADIFERRCVDYWRSKSEGFGDRRYGNDNRLVLADDPDPADHDVDFETLIDDRRRARWQAAADTCNESLSRWVMLVLDAAAEEVRSMRARGGVGVDRERARSIAHPAIDFTPPG